MIKDDLVLGIHAVGHDIGITVMSGDGTPVLVAEEERWSRRKGGSFFLSADWVLGTLSEAGVARERISTLGIASIPALAISGPALIRNGEPRLSQARAQSAVVHEISARLPNLERVQHVRHHLCHAASAFLSRPFREAPAAVVLDGKGEYESGSIWQWRQGGLRRIDAVLLPASIGKFFYAIASWAGLDGVEREGKLMALASYGTPRHVELMRCHFLKAADDGTYIVSAGLARRPMSGQEWLAHAVAVLGERKNDDPLHPESADIAASAQMLLEELVEAYVRRALRLTGLASVVVAGGVFMNSVVNGKLQHLADIAQIWVPPFASDTGIAFGAAAASVLSFSSAPVHQSLLHPYLGTSIDEVAVEILLESEHLRLRQLGIVAEHVENPTAVLASEIASGKIVACAYGRSEVGPRALGHRSLFARADDSVIAGRLNELVKERETWRPFAPMVDASDTERIFGIQIESPYMTSTAACRRPELLLGALHVDDTARVQTVAADGDPFLVGFLQEVSRFTGVAAVINTSLNVRGQPIVRTAQEALDFFCDRPIDLLYLGGWILRRSTVTLTSQCGMSPLSEGTGDSTRSILVYLANDPLALQIDDLVLKVDAIGSWLISSRDGRRRDGLSSTQGNLVFVSPVPAELLAVELPRVHQALTELGKSWHRDVWIRDTYGMTSLSALPADSSLASWFWLQRPL